MNSVLGISNKFSEVRVKPFLRGKIHYKWYSIMEGMSWRFTGRKKYETFLVVGRATYLVSCFGRTRFIILGARSFLSTLFFLCYSRNDVPKEIKVTRSQLRFFFPYRTFPKEISGSGSAPTTHQICLLFCSALYIFSSYEKEWICMKFFIKKRNEWRIFVPLIW